jgi:hypothetical protein
VYALTDPDSHLVVYDPRAKTFTDRGQLGPTADPTRYLLVLANGDVFHSLGPSIMARYSASAGAIERLPLVPTGVGSYEPPYTLAVALDGRRFFGVGLHSGQVYLYEPRQREIGVRIVGTAIPEGYRPPDEYYTMTTAPDGTIYYTGQYSSEGSYDLFIYRLAPNQAAPQVVGRVAPLAPPPAGYSRQVARGVAIQGSTVTPDGTLIVMTAYPLRLLLFRGMSAR